MYPPLRRVTPAKLLLGVAVLCALLAGYLGYRLWALGGDYRDATHALSTETAVRAAVAEELALTTEALEMTREDRDTLAEELERERNRNEEFAEQIRDITGTVGTLDKLARTDEELLQKYSKVYFLNEHFVPPKLSAIADAYVYDESRTFEIDSRVLPYLKDMIDEAKEDGVDIWVASAYRSFQYQSQLKGAYTVTYGSGANAFSADQGYSEHQLGTTVDLTTTGLGGGLTGFQNTKAYEWLTKNAHRFGFILSYPEGNSYYVFEPWHWRFVGTELARDLHRDGKRFYDLDQRTLNEYLITVFD